MTRHRGDGQSFEDILEHLRQSRGFDFTAYKRPSLMRRVVRRMHTVDVPTFEAYLDYLQVRPEEFEALFNTILINVTSFFRDADVWEYLSGEVLPALVRDRPGGPIRIWSAGCASGQEAYSLAMLLAERIGLEGLRDCVKIYATDVDQDALTDARHASFRAPQVADVPPTLLEKYFNAAGTTYTIHRELRRAVIFGDLDLLQDAPISRVDFLLCRNTLMYFNAEAQSRVLSRFASSLNPNGLLLLGRAEMLFSHSTMFTPVDLKRRLFRVNARANSRAPSAAPSLPSRGPVVDDVPEDHRLRQAVFETAPLVQLVFDQAGTLVAANARARHQFAISPSDIGRALRDLEVSYRPAELRGAIDRAMQERRDVTIKDVHWAAGGETRHFDVTVSALFDDHHTPIGARVVFDDVTRCRVLQSELYASRQELDTAYEELESTREELETTKEELQTTNEQLETVNEELQSTNEELQTMNDEMRSRTTDADAMNLLLESVFSSLTEAVAVVDRDYRVRIWNGAAKELWGLRSDEAAGMNLLTLDIGMPVAELLQPINDVLGGTIPAAERTLTATNRRGKAVQCKVRLIPLHPSERSETSGVILFMETIDVP